MSAVATLASLVAGRGAQGADLRVGVSDVTGAPDAGLTNALAEALTDAGLEAARSTPTGGACIKGCMRVVVRQSSPGHFLVEVSAGANVLRTPVELEATASRFDLAHALAIEVEMLTDRARTPARRQRRAPLVAATPAPFVSASEPPSGVSSEPVNTAAASTGATPIVGAPVPAPIPVAASTAPSPPAPPADTRLALSVGFTTLAAPSGDLMMLGFAFGARVAINRRVDIGTGITMLKPQLATVNNVAYVHEVTPLSAWTTSVLPGLPSLRGGAGLDASLISENEKTFAWSIGVLARLEGRHAIRNVTFLGAVQAAYHPPAWHISTIPSGGTIPPWTLAASVGCEFKLF